VKATVENHTGRPSAVRRGTAHQATRLRLVANHGRLLPREQAGMRREPVRSRSVRPRPPERPPAQGAPVRRVAAAPRKISHNPVPERIPVRLTRRGRAVVTAAVVMLASAISLALVLWVPRG
jgi:hypothetical protein